MYKNLLYATFVLVDFYCRPYFILHFPSHRALNYLFYILCAFSIFISFLVCVCVAETGYQRWKQTKICYHHMRNETRLLEKIENLSVLKIFLGLYYEPTFRFSES